MNRLMNSDGSCSSWTNRLSDHKSARSAMVRVSFNPVSRNITPPREDEGRTSTKKLRDNRSVSAVLPTPPSPRTTILTLVVMAVAAALRLSGSRERERESRLFLSSSRAEALRRERGAGLGELQEERGGRETLVRLAISSLQVQHGVVNPVVRTGRRLEAVRPGDLSVSTPDRPTMAPDRRTNERTDGPLCEMKLRPAPLCSIRRVSPTSRDAVQPGESSPFAL